MSEALGTVVDGLLEVDPAGLSDVELKGLVVEGRRTRARLDALLARADAAFDARQLFADDDAKSAAAWLAHCARIPIGDARSAMKIARSLRHLPHIAEAFDAGEINAAHARALCAAINPRTAAQMVEDQKMLLDAARELDFDDFITTLRYWSQLADPDGTEEQAERQKAKRSFSFAQSFGGIWFGQITLHAVAGAIFANIFNAIEQELFDADWAEARERLGPDAKAGDLHRTPQQRRADALVEMAIRAATAPKDGKRPAPLFTVLVGLETFLGRVLELANGAVITPGEAAEYLDGADVERVVFDTPKRVIEVGRTTRLFIGALRRAIEVRDRRCQGFACRTPADRCHVDDVDPVTNGGETTQDNGELQCGWHNRRKGGRPPPPCGKDGEPSD